MKIISGVIIRVTIVITPIRGLITPLRTTHEPPGMEINVRYQNRDLQQLI